MRMTMLCSSLVAPMFCAVVLGFSTTYTQILNSCPVFFPPPLPCETNGSYSATCVLCILHWKEDGLEMLFRDNYDRLLREANVKEQAVVSACGVTLITETHDA